MAIRVAWDRNPVSIHGPKSELELLVQKLRNDYGVRKHSMIMQDRESDDEAVFFVYQPCDPKWFLEDA